MAFKAMLNLINSCRRALMMTSDNKARNTKTFSLSLWVIILVGCGGADRNIETSTSVPTSPPSQVATAEPPNAGPSATPQPAPTNPTRIGWASGDYQFGDLYQPSLSAADKKPVVVMIHGGCWSSSYSLRLMDELSADLASRGFFVWNIEYRSLGNGGEWPNMFLDVARATDYLRTLANQYPIDTNRVVTMGHSAGGHLALWLAGRGNIPMSSELYNPTPQPVAGVVSLAGIGDLESGACSYGAQAIIGDNISAAERTARLASASPVKLLPFEIETVMISGDKDSIVPARLSQAFADSAVASGDISSHLILTNADHFTLIDAETMDMNLLDDLVTSLSN